MLETLHISNYALIDSIDITFGPGLNVITGETGAGKSIILGAISLILGGRAESRVVQNHERKSVIEATFNVGDYKAIRNFCAANDIDPDDCGDGRLIMRREIAPTGRSRAFINDTPVPVTKLREVAIHLVDIHSQHQNLLLAQADFQLNIIDSLAGNDKLLEEYRSRYSALRECMKQLKKMQAEVERSRDDEEFLRFQLDQLDALSLREGEQEELEREREVQENLTDIKSRLTVATEALSAGEPNILSLLSQAREACEQLDGLLNPDDDIVGRLESVSVELQDISDSITAADRDLDAEPSALEEIDARLEAIYSMERRHKVESVEELIALRESLRKRIALVDDGDEQIAALGKRARRALALARESAAALTAARCRQAEALSKELRERAVPLGMKNLQCDIRVTQADLSATGADKVEFLFAFNKNQPLSSVGDTASGGEISRLMLSIKAIIARHMQLPSIILDEIDTGVSGDVAARMGDMMASIARFSQVITITHLPQVAAKGSTHFKVYKEDDELATHTHIRCLTPDERVSELALMLSGNPDDATARLGAEALLSNNNPTTQIQS